MTNIEKPKFHILEVSGKNYLSRCLDMEMHLQEQGLVNAITEDETSNAKDKTNALIFICRHFHERLQTQYLSVQDSQILWRRLKDQYDHIKTFVTYSELISVLLTAEQTNELLLKNHDLRHAGSKTLPKAHANFEKNTRHFKGYKCSKEYNPRRNDKKFNRSRKSNFGLNHNKEKPKNVTNESICYRCSIIGHWSHTCRTPKYFVDLYQVSLKNMGKHGESHTIEINPTTITTIEANNISFGGTPLAPEVANASLDVFDFFEDL
ncbi:hypothetical protein EUGRSUZ_L01342 [Eucalyptus grandis]|uniref:CCHC-type domain-containing protein n=1 Tax=Eucalyptus grandis TaxID=71139 RepID=A0A058ZTD3_EUCGR|nr:hypothetical protein EUGRSUZ_L01342 [Eucalyptus grandis]